MAQKQMQGIAPSPMTPMTRLLEEVSVCTSLPVYKYWHAHYEYLSILFFVEYQFVASCYVVDCLRLLVHQVLGMKGPALYPPQEAVSNNKKCTMV